MKRSIAVVVRPPGDEGRLDALRATLNDYRELMADNQPVHTWE